MDRGRCGKRPYLMALRTSRPLSLGLRKSALSGNGDSATAGNIRVHSWLTCPARFMKTKLAFLLPVFLALRLAPAGAAVRYVNLANPSPTPPFTTWASAATNIQNAIDAANAGDESKIEVPVI